MHYAYDPRVWDEATSLQFLFGEGDAATRQFLSNVVYGRVPVQYAYCLFSLCSVLSLFSLSSLSICCLFAVCLLSVLFAFQHESKTIAILDL